MDQLDSPEAPERRNSWAFQLALCLLGPLFFVCYLAILAPLPSLYLHVGTPNLQRGRLWTGLALLIGLLLSFQVQGALWSLCFFLFASLPAFVLGELLLRKAGAVRAVLGALAAVTLASAASGFVVAQVQGVKLIPAIEEQAAQFVRDTVDHIMAQERSDLPESSVDELKAVKENPSAYVNQMPGYAATLLLLLCTLPCVALIRWNPKGFLRRTGIARDFLRRWRSPDWLAWFLLLSWGFLLSKVPTLEEWGGNLLKPLLLIYFFQGMSNLAYFLDSQRLRGPIRVFFYGRAMLFLPQLVVCLGFIDVFAMFREYGLRKLTWGSRPDDPDRKD